MGAFERQNVEPNSLLSQNGWQMTNVFGDSSAVQLVQNLGPSHPVYRGRSSLFGAEDFTQSEVSWKQ